MNEAPKSLVWQGETVYLARIEALESRTRTTKTLGFSCLRYTYANKAGVIKMMQFQFPHTVLDWQAIASENSAAPVWEYGEKEDSFHIDVLSQGEYLGFLESIENEA
jgi:hypothetical protein